MQNKTYIAMFKVNHRDIIIEWASAQVPPTPLYLGGTVEREREGEREREERERWMDG